MLHRYLLLAALFVATVAYAQDGIEDNSFTRYRYNSNVTQSVDVHPGSGSFVVAMVTPFGYTARFDEDGNQTNFANQIIQTSGVYAYAVTILAQANESVLMYGRFPNYRGSWPNRNLLRFYSDGTVDSSFHPPVFQMDSTRGTVQSMFQTHDGGYLLRGYFTQVGADTTDRQILKLRQNGSVDTSFRIPSVVMPYPYYQSRPSADGSFLTLATLRTKPDSAVLVRVMENGNQDTSFHMQKHWTNSRYFPSVFPLASGRFFAYSDEGIYRHLSDGGVDTSFRPDFYLGLVLPLIEQADGKLIMGRFIDDQPGWHVDIIRLHRNGKIDSTFTRFSMPAKQGGIQAFLQPTGKILVWANRSNYPNDPMWIYRLNNTLVTAATPSLVEKGVAYPNPASQSLTLQSGKPLNMIRIVSPSGQTVFQTHTLAHVYTVDISTLTPGLYTAWVAGTQWRFVKQ